MLELTDALKINSDMTAKIIDFGTSRVLDERSVMTGSLGTPAWIAPEVLTSTTYSEKADVYSFGIGKYWPPSVNSSSNVGATYR